MELTELIGYIISAVTGVVGWYAGRKKQQNDMLSSMQASINLLAGENNRLITELTEVKKQNVELIFGQEQTRIEIQSLKLENEALRKEVSLYCEKITKLKKTTR